MAWHWQSYRQTFDVLIASEPEIRALRVSRLALFGSVLHDQARPDSDVDLLVQFTPGAKMWYVIGSLNTRTNRLDSRVLN